MPPLKCLACLSAVVAAILAPSVAHAAWTPGGVPLAQASFSFGHTVVEDTQGGVLTFWSQLFVSQSDLSASRVLDDGTPSAALPLAGAVVGSPTFIAPFTLATPVGGDLFVAAYNPLLNAQNHSMQMFRLHPDGTLAAGCPDTGQRVVSGFRPIIPRLDADGTGGAVLAWFERQPGPITVPLTSVNDLRVLRIAADGSPAPGWPFNGVLLSAPLPGTTPVLYTLAIAVARDGAGGMFVAWQDSSDGIGDVYVQHVDGTGQIVPGWPVAGRAVCSVASLKYQLQLIRDDAGGVYVAWSEHRGPEYAAYLTHLTATGTDAPGWPAAGAQVSGTGVPANLGRLARDASGGAIVGYLEYRNGMPPGVYAKRYLANGSVVAGWEGGAPVVENPTGDDLADMLPDGAGGAFFLTGGAPGASTRHDGLTAFALDATGAHAAGLPAAGLPITAATVTEAQLLPAESGSAIATWRVDAVYPIDLRGFKFSIDRPTPVQASLVSATAEPGRVRIEWRLTESDVTSVDIERRARPGEWTRIGSVRVDGVGRAVIEDTAAPQGEVDYRMVVRTPGGELRLGEVEVTVPAPFTLALGVQPNPARRGRLELSFTLPEAAPVRIEVLDVSGRLVAHEVEAMLPAGAHLRSVGAALAPGVYMVRLVQGGRSIVQRAVVME